MSTRTFDQVRAWFAGLDWRDRTAIRAGGGACCSNPNPQMHQLADASWVIRCMGCGA